MTNTGVLIRPRESIFVVGYRPAATATDALALFATGSADEPASS